MSAITKIMRSEGCSWREAKARANAALPPAGAWRDKLAGIASRMRMLATVQAGDRRTDDAARHYHSLTGFAAEIEALLAEPEAPQAVRAETLAVVFDQWAKNREEEAKTMCAKRKPTEVEIDRAMVIGKWFMGWTDETGPCPISVTNGHWGKKLCALFEWIAVLEAEASKLPTPPGVNPQTGGQ